MKWIQLKPWVINNPSLRMWEEFSFPWEGMIDWLDEEVWLELKSGEMKCSSCLFIWLPLQYMRDTYRSAPQRCLQEEEKRDERGETCYCLP